MKKILLYIIGLLTGGIVWSSCSSDDNWTELGQGNGTNFSLQIKSGELQSRATVEESESSIKTLDIYLYPVGAEDKNALFHYSHELNTINTSGSEKVTVNVPGTVVKDLFPSGATTCTAYVVANKETLVLPTEDTSMSSLKGKELNAADFTKQQELFIMDGSNTVNYDATTRTITGTVNLFRAASKISLIVTGVEDVVKDDFGNKWHSDPAEEVMKVAFYNGVKKATIDVNAVPYEIEDEDYFNIPSNPGRVLSSFNVTNDDSSTSTHYTHELPFYSYSSEWTSGDPTAPYLIVVVPWQKLDQDGNPVGEFKPCYYQIPINETNLKLERNHYYEIKLNIGILGSFTPDEPKTITDATYVVLNWSNAETSAGLKEYRYLVVDKNFVEMDNVNSVDVGMATSHDISYRILSITKPNYSNETKSTTTIYSYNEETEESTGTTTSFTFSPNSTVATNCQQVTLYHELNNNSSSQSHDFVPYTIRVKVWHTDNPSYFEVIEYVQYPAIYVVDSYNNGTNDAASQNNNLNHNKNTNKSGFGYVMVNTLYGDRYDYNEIKSGNKWQTVEGFDSSSKNPNMYIITTTALDQSLSSNYIIGDSRESNEYDSSQIGFTSVQDVNGNTLQKYRPTKTDRDDYLSPKFRIASAYGQLGTNTLTHEEAKKRCAAYQEYGYPAGRWRLATTAELKYIATLCAKEALPSTLFGASNYWSATHICNIDTDRGTVSTSTPSGSAFLRCVYDDWYWGSQALSDKTVFTWGDQ